VKVSGELADRRQTVARAQITGDEPGTNLVGNLEVGGFGEAEVNADEGGRHASFVQYNCTNVKTLPILPRLPRLPPPDAPGPPLRPAGPATAV